MIYITDIAELLLRVASKKQIADAAYDVIYGADANAYDVIYGANAYAVDANPAAANEEKAQETIAFRTLLQTLS